MPRMRVSQASIETESRLRRKDLVAKLQVWLKWVKAQRQRHLKRRVKCRHRVNQRRVNRRRLQPLLQVRCQGQAYAVRPCLHTRARSCHRRLQCHLRHSQQGCQEMRGHVVPLTRQWVTESRIHQCLTRWGQRRARLVKVRLQRSRHRFGRQPVRGQRRRHQLSVSSRRHQLSISSQLMVVRLRVKV